jgi:plastocyanin
MNGRGVRLAVVIVVVAIVIAGLLFFSGGSNPPANSNQNQQPDGNTTGSRRNAGEAVDTDRVTIESFSFTPANISVKIGTRVTWINNDSTAHTVTERDGQPGPVSPNLNHNQSYSFRFIRAGSYHYHCTIHPEMTGTVTVTP